MWRLPDDMRGVFQKPFGPVLSTAQVAERLTDLDTIVCVGDFVSRAMIDEGFRPKVIIVDYKTERREVEEDLRKVLGAYGKSVLRVANPAATVTKELYLAVVQALRLTGPVRIEVEGEEDLAGLPVFAEAPEGTVVLYGMPKQGMVLVRVDEAMRSRARTLLARMRVTA